MQQDICPHMKYVYPTNDEKFQNKTFEVNKNSFFIFSFIFLESFGKNGFQMFCLLYGIIKHLDLFACDHFFLIGRLYPYLIFQENCNFYGCGQFPKGQLQHIYNHYEGF